MTAHTVYALCDETGFVIYVGCTMNLKQRLKGHRSVGVRHTKAVAIARFDNKADAREHEKRLIRGLGPCRNSQFLAKAETVGVHGTLGRYTSGGCRCEQCKFAWARSLWFRHRDRPITQRLEVVHALVRRGRRPSESLRIASEVAA